MDNEKDIFFDRPDLDTWALARINHKLLREIERSGKWQKEDIPDLPLDTEQMMSMVKGYSPSWECRYAPYFLGGWVYIARSGYWLKKIRYEKGDDGFFHITDSYTTEKEKGRNLLIQIIVEGHFSPSIVDERLQRVLTEQHETMYKL